MGRLGDAFPGTGPSPTGEGKPADVFQSVFGYGNPFLCALLFTITAAPCTLRGQLVHQLIGRGCTHTSERTEMFMCMSLDVKPNIQESLSTFVAGEMLSGDNAYFCATCDAKASLRLYSTLAVNLTVGCIMLSHSTAGGDVQACLSAFAAPHTCPPSQAVRAELRHVHQAEGQHPLRISPGMRWP